jgi:hypothetical protein
MTKEDASALLHGREYRNEMTRTEEEIFRDSGLVIAIGQSDDIGGLFGAISDEIGAYNGGEARLIRLRGKLIIRPTQDNEDELIICGWVPPKIVAAIKFEWCPSDFEGSWRISANVPFSTFDITEDGKLFCRGVVIETDGL